MEINDLEEKKKKREKTRGNEETRLEIEFWNRKVRVSEPESNYHYFQQNIETFSICS